MSAQEAREYGLIEIVKFMNIRLKAGKEKKAIISFVCFFNLKNGLSIAEINTPHYQSLK